MLSRKEIDARWYAANSVAKRAYSKRYHADNRMSAQKAEERYEATARGMAAKLVARSKRRAQANGWEFCLSVSRIRDAILRGQCEVTGIPFDWSRERASYFRPFLPSLDRIDPRGGYTDGNVRVVVTAFNVALSDWGEEVFKRLATAYLAQQTGEKRMTGTNLIVPTTERKLGIMNTGKVDITKAKASLSARGSSTRLFPGDSLNFKKGFWYAGYGKKKVRIKTGAKYVMNLANAVETWQTFVDGRPKFAPLAYLINGESRCPREEMGQLDESRWDKGDNGDGDPMDPVQAITVCPIRAPKGVELHHISLGSLSSRIAFEQLLGEWLDQYDDNPGKLPIVELTEADERTRKGSKQTYLVPTFSIVGWEAATKIDNPGPGGIEVAQPDEEPEEEEAPAPSRKATASASKTKARAPEPDADEEPEDAPDPRQGNGKSNDKRNKPAVEEPDDDEDDEAAAAAAVEAVRKAKAAKAKAKAAATDDEDDDKPVVRQRTKAAPAPEPEEEEPVRPRQRRAALH